MHTENWYRNFFGNVYLEDERRREYNIKMSLSEVVCEDGMRMTVTQHRVQGRVPQNIR
jgi:hypothetical protein